MKWLLTLIIALFVSVSVALITHYDPGYVLLGYGHWTVETTLALFVVVLLLAFLVIYYTLRFASNALHMPQRMHEWSSRRRTRRARKDLTRGLIELAEGHWSNAERKLVKHVGDSETPLLNYLAAARAAQGQEAHERRDAYLHQAHESLPSADIAVGLTQAELQISHRQREQALATLQHLHTIAPKHTLVLSMLKDLYISLSEWRSLIELLPSLRKRKAVSADDLDKLEIRAYTELLSTEVRTHGIDAMEQVWRSIPHKLHFNHTILCGYIRHLIKFDRTAIVEPVLREALKKNWSEYLVYLYGRIKGDDSNQQLLQAERWIRTHPASAMLFLTLGRLSERNSLWGKARSYFETSLGLAEHADTYYELGTLMEQTGDVDKAREYYRKGLELSSGKETNKAGNTITPPQTPVAESLG